MRLGCCYEPRFRVLGIRLQGNPIIYSIPILLWYFSLSPLTADQAQQVRRACAEAKKHGLGIAANQIMFNLLCFQSPELQATVQACRENNVKIIAYAPIGQGLLTQALTDEKFSKIRLAKMTRLGIDELQELRAAIERVLAGL